MEEYRFGDWASGDKHTQALNFDVALRTTTTTTTTTSTTTTTKTPTTATTTISTTSLAYTTSTIDSIPSTIMVLYDDYDESSVEFTTKNSVPENKVLDGDSNESEYDNEDSINNDYEYTVHQEDNNNTESRSDMPIYDHIVEILAIEDETPEEVPFNKLYIY